MSETNKNKKETISKEFINMEIENEEFKKESKDSNLVSGLSEIAPIILIIIIILIQQIKKKKIVAKIISQQPIIQKIIKTEINHL